LARFLASREYQRPDGFRVAIIGSGPAGLAAAQDLALMGMGPHIFETEPRPARNATPNSYRRWRGKWRLLWLEDGTMSEVMGFRFDA
jgi:2-polyprenyl-6-methoxyphenol hydroxylase-like FAD-dependent oxidoreductase